MRTRMEACASWREHEAPAMHIATHTIAQETCRDICAHCTFHVATAACHHPSAKASDDDEQRTLAH